MNALSFVEKLDLLATLCFLGFVLAGLSVVVSRHVAPRFTTHTLNGFLLYALAVSFGAGLTQTDAWPFSHWPLIALLQPDEVDHIRVMAVDETGRVHDIDYRAWEPVVFEELMAFLEGAFNDLPDEQRDGVASYLLQKAEDARARALDGGRIGTFDRYLGPFSAPSFLLHPDLWSEPENVPESPFVAIRIYRESWNLYQRRDEEGDVSRRLVYGFPRP